MVVFAWALKHNYIATSQRTKPVILKSVDDNVLTLSERGLHTGTLNTEQSNTEPGQYRIKQSLEHLYGVTGDPLAARNGLHHSFFSFHTDRLLARSGRSEPATTSLRAL